MEEQPHKKAKTEDVAEENVTNKEPHSLLYTTLKYIGARCFIDEKMLGILPEELKERVVLFKKSFNGLALRNGFYNKEDNAIRSSGMLINALRGNSLDEWLFNNLSEENLNFFYEYEPSKDEPSDDKQDTILMIAVRYSSVRFIEKLFDLSNKFLTEDEQTKLFEKQGYRILWYAIKYGNLEKVKQVLGHGIQPYDALTADLGECPDSRIIGYFHEEGTTDGFKGAGLSKACYMGQAKNLEALLTYNEYNDHYRFSRHKLLNANLNRACTKGHSAIVEILLNAGACSSNGCQVCVNENRNSSTGMNPLITALAGGHMDTAQLLIDRGAKIDSSYLLRAAQNGKIHSIKFLLSQGVPVDFCNEYGKTALMYAAQCGHLETIRELLRCGAHTGLYDFSGKNALDYFIETKGYREEDPQYYSVMVELLLSTKEDHALKNGETS